MGVQTFGPNPGPPAHPPVPGEEPDPSEPDAAISELAAILSPGHMQARQPVLLNLTVRTWGHVRILGVVLLAVFATALLTARWWERATFSAMGAVFLAARGCCSWNGVDCGHGGEWCQESPETCTKCEGKWGNFQDVCNWGHPSAPPLPEVWHYGNESEVRVKVMTYNLEWWATGGGAAPQVITSTSKHTPYDVMGFQECNNPWQVIWQSGLQHEYEAMHVDRGKAADICIVWRNVTWKLLSSGDQQVSRDVYGARYAMWARLQHNLTKQVVFFVNHHGPLPPNTGGVPGGPATASSLLNVITTNARKGDAVILVGDFNADDGSLTIRQIECQLKRIAWGDTHNGMDSVFANLEILRSNSSHGKTVYPAYGAHNALNMVVNLTGGKPQIKKEVKKEEEEEETGWWWAYKIGAHGNQQTREAKSQNPVEETQQTGVAI